MILLATGHEFCTLKLDLQKAAFSKLFYGILGMRRVPIEQSLVNIETDKHGGSRQYFFE